MKLFYRVAVVVITVLGLQVSNGIACTRVVYQGPEQTIITARSMDWRDEIPADLWLFPGGMQRNGMVGESSIRWTSRYGSIVTSSFGGRQFRRNERTGVSG